MMPVSVVSFRVNEGDKANLAIFDLQVYLLPTLIIHVPRISRFASPMPVPATDLPDISRRTCTATLG